MWLKNTICSLLVTMFLGGVVQAEPWPNFYSRWKFKVQKSAGAEMTDVFWAHLHAGDAGFESFTLFPDIKDGQVGNASQDPSTIPPGNQVRYTAHGVPISGWLNAPWVFVVTPDNVGLSTLLDGIHDLSLEVQGPNKADIRPHPMYLHLHRGVAVDPRVPILGRNHTTDYDDYGPDVSPGVVYVDRSARHMVGYPVDPSVTPWNTPPQGTDLYQEEMAPHTDLFKPVQMWWQEPLGTVSDGLTFIRGMGPKSGTEHHYSLYDAVGGGQPDVNAFGFNAHRNYPYRDGPRGIGWASPFITGQVDSTGGLAFVETGGPLRYMYPDGTLITVAGWRVKPGKDPVWIFKPLTTIRTNMELRGTWVNGVRTEPADRGFHYATDVAIDPLNENIWYVASNGDNVIWKVEIEDRVNWNATVSVFAGSVVHQAGYLDEQGILARFSGPTSIVFDPVCDCMYVADQNNDSIRKITRNKVVTTVYGGPGMGARLATRGLAMGNEDCQDVQPFAMECYNETANRTVAKLEVSVAEAATGIKPEVYRPMTVRVDSTGRIVVLDMGFATIRRIDPVTHVTKQLGLIEGRFARWVLGWAWLDVDRWGHSGPLDSVYFLQGVAASLQGHVGDVRYNEVFAWLPAEGGTPEYLAGIDYGLTPDGWGKIAETDLPHYPWMVAVDPRGALYLSGMGEHGITRIRMRKPADPYPVSLGAYNSGKVLWQTGEPVGGVSFNFKFGHGVHNLLGFPDAWGLSPNVTDAELIEIFDIPLTIQNTPTRLAELLAFIRVNRGNQLAQPVTSCLMSITTCPNYPTYVGEIYDTYDGAGTNQARCMLRASDFYNWCATNVSVRARYYSDATMVEANSYPNTDPVGSLDFATCDYIWGYAIDLDTLATPIAVHVYDGPGFGGWVGGYPTDWLREDVNTYYGASGTHGYFIPTPMQFKTGTAHTVYVYGINSDTWGGGNPALGNAGMSLNCPAP